MFEDSIDWEKVKFSEDIPPEVVTNIQKAIDELPVRIKADIREIARIPLGHTPTYYYASGKISLPISSTGKFSAEALYHEVAHASSKRISSPEYWSDAARAIGWAKEAEEILVGGVRSVELFKTHPETGRVLSETMADKFGLWCRRKPIPKDWEDFFKKWYPLKEPRIPEKTKETPLEKWEREAKTKDHRFGR